MYKVSFRMPFKRTLREVDVYRGLFFQNMYILIHRYRWKFNVPSVGEIGIDQ